MRSLVIFLAGIVSLNVSADQISVPNEFVSGETAVAADVNENFTAIATGVNNNDTAIQANAAEIAVKMTNTIQSCEAGSAIRSIDTDGNVECEADDVGGDSSAGDIGANTTAIGVNAAAIQVNVDAIAAKQASLKNSCPAGQFITAIAVDGTATCADDLQGGTGSAADIETNKKNIAANLVKITANSAASDKNAEDIKTNASGIASKQASLTATICGAGEILTSIDPATGVGVCKALAIPDNEVTSAAILNGAIVNADISTTAEIDIAKINGDAGIDVNSTFKSVSPSATVKSVATNSMTVPKGGFFMVNFAGDASVVGKSKIELTIKATHPKTGVPQSLTRILSNANAGTLDIPFNAAWVYLGGATNGGTYEFEATVREAGSATASFISNITFAVMYFPERY